MIAESRNAPIIAVRSLGYRYANAAAPALDHIDLDIPAGCIMGLLGPNGAGKSTLLALLTGQLQTQTGSIDIAGFSAQTQMGDIKTISALVPQDYAFYPSLTVRENLDFFAGIYRLRERYTARLEHCVHVCSLSSLLDRRAEHCSGGEKRRLNLAIALLNAPQILYLDEPTVGIDPESRQQILAALRQLKQAGTTIIYTSHYMEEVEAICDELALINHGRIVARDSMFNLLRQDNRRNALIRLPQPINRPALDALAIFNPTPHDANSLHLDMSLTADGLNTLAQILAQHQIVPEHLQMGISRLEQIYFSLLDAEPQY